MKALYSILILLFLFGINKNAESQEITKSDFQIEVDYNSQDAILDLSYLLYSSLNVYNFDKIELLKRPGTLKNSFENLKDYDLIIDITDDISDSLIGTSRGEDIYKYFTKLKYVIKDKNEVLLVRLTSSNKIFFSNSVQINRHTDNNSKLEFTSLTPQEKIIPLNTLYSFDFDAEYTDKNYQIAYNIVPTITNGNYKTDEIASIDSETGEFEFFAKVTGRYVFQIKASVDVDGEIIETKENFSVIVDNCDKLSTIEVNLVNQDNENIPDAKLTLKTNASSNSESKLFVQETNSDGIAFFDVPFGNYSLYYNKDNVIQYFNNTLNEKDAQKIEIKDCDTQISIKFYVRDDLDTNIVKKIKFVETPRIWNLELNEEFTFDFNAIVDENPNEEIVYSVRNLQQDMSIDSKSGEFSWTPKAGGYFEIFVNASLKNDPLIYSEYIWKVNVSHCVDKSILNFVLLNKDDAQINGAKVTLFKIDEDTKNMNDNNLYYKIKTYQTIKTNDSSNTFEADKGEYVLSVSYNGEYYWYSNAKTVNDSEIIEVKCDENQNITMYIDYKEPTTKRFKGYCLDENNKGVKANITFEGKKANSNAQGAKVFMIQTMDNGYYTLDLPLDYNFKAYAMKENSNKPLYYVRTYDPNQATIFNTSNFKLDQLNFVFEEDKSNSDTKFVDISGNVTSSKNNVVSYCIIIAFALDSNNLINNEKTFSYISYDGKFNFRVEQGNYIFYAVSKYKLLVPGFYYEGGIARFTWEEATIVDLNRNSSDEINIILHELDKEPGLARLNGSVKGNSGNNSLSNANLLLQSNGKSIDYAITDYEGKFDLNEIEDGEYDITVSKVGYKSYKDKLILDKNEPVNLDIYLEEAIGMSSVENGFDINIAKVYPNPSTNYIELELDSKVNFNQFEIFNLKGELITSGSYNLGMKVDVSKLNSGKYFIKLINNDDVLLAPFNVER